MVCEEIIKFFFKKASTRISLKYNEMKNNNLLSCYSQVLPKDGKLFGRIVNNETNSKNRFLIPDNALWSFIEIEDKDNWDGLMKYEEYGIVKILEFENEKNVLWGRDIEILEYAYDLFKLLLDELSCNKDLYGIDIELLYLDYVPFARNKTYLDLFNDSISKSTKYNKFKDEEKRLIISMEYDVDADKIYRTFSITKDDAIRFLYLKCAERFINSFIDYARNTPSFHCIPKLFQKNYIIETFVPIMKDYTPNETSLGLRVNRIIHNDLSHIAELKPIYSSPFDSYFNILTEQSARYMHSLKQIQRGYIEILINEKIKKNEPYIRVVLQDILQYDQQGLVSNLFIEELENNRIIA